MEKQKSEMSSKPNPEKSRVQANAPMKTTEEKRYEVSETSYVCEESQLSAEQIIRQRRSAVAFDGKTRKFTKVKIFPHLMLLRLRTHKTVAEFS